MMPPLAKLRGGRPSDDGRPSDQRKKIRTSKDEQEKAELRAQEKPLKAELEIERQRLELKQIRARIMASKDEEEKAELRAQVTRREDYLRRLILLSLGHVDDPLYLFYDESKQSRDLLDFV